ncbi:3'-5' exonuclease, partial [Lysinibacillus xylanilyticus]|uniref:3'-5' exonuclease n=1 Tax=Lysinibacillus xylanilyticus TaxID=582475 RepID=UPI0036DDDBDA
GDGDQSIYSFLGAMEDAIGNFEEILGIEPKRSNLTVNRRCRKDTMPFALNVINSIKTRTPRDIVTNKIGGELIRVAYKETTEQINAIYKTMKEKTSGNMGILFRNKNQSIILSRFLYNRGIQANFINANHCMEHRLYTLFIDTIRECFINKSQKGLSLLHRLMPAPKKALEEFFEFDEKTGISKTCPTAHSWGSLDFAPLFKNPKNYMSNMQQAEFLKMVATESTSIIASDCVPQLLDMFYRNYFNILTEAQEDPFVELVLGWAKEDLSVGYNLRTTIDNHEKNINKFMVTSRKVSKLNICTMHGTKGLEFNHVILNLEKEKTPPGIVLSPKAIQFQEEEESRLIYVGATRQIDSLTVLCNMQHPHRLSDEKYFESDEPTVVETKFSGEKPAILQDKLLGNATPRVGRRSMLLED